jgi:hypothetical protein
METKQMSDSIKEIATALSKAQGAMESAKKDTKNDFFRSKYADLASIINAGKQAMLDNGLAITQTLEPDIEKAIVVTTLMHTSGEWIKSTIALKPVNLDKEGREKPITPQSMGSAISYARRYGYQAILGLSAEDDDGNTASTTTAPRMAKSEHFCRMLLSIVKMCMGKLSATPAR